MKSNKIKLILKDHWETFLKKYKYKIRNNVKVEVEKVLNCRNIKNGYIEFKCGNCGESKKVGFTCKSRFCTSCGKVYTDNWIDSMLGTLLNVKHRHIVFTIPEELRIFFGKDRSRLKILPKCAAKAVTSWMHNLNKSEEFTPGIVTVIHTFGRDLKWNPHVHMLITEGGKGKKTAWRHIRYFSFEALRKRWQKVLLDEISYICRNSTKIRELKNKLYKDKDKGFYVHAKTEIKSARTAAKYVGRYVGRPAIADSRILAYDGINVTYKYTRHEDNKEIVEKVHAYEFIKKIIIHIPERNFKMIRYFGIYSRRSKGLNNFIKMIDERILKLRKSLSKWEYRILATFGVDPCKCTKCNEVMRFYDIVYKNYGSIRTYLKNKIISETEEKLEEAIEIYAITKGILRGKIVPKTT